jgi:uncharacterized cysteine cluster protein YcgN (CxxCxxCC family)
MSEEFWRTKSLAELTKEQWEALCDGCAQCCLLKLEDEDDGRIAYTRVTCRLLDLDSCRCTHYDERHVRVPDCIEFDAAAVAQLTLAETVHRCDLKGASCRYGLSRVG